jgi:hypothetical protein
MVMPHEMNGATVAEGVLDGPTCNAKCCVRSETQSNVIRAHKANRNCKRKTCRVHVVHHPVMCSGVTGV